MSPVIDPLALVDGRFAPENTIVSGRKLLAFVELAPLNNRVPEREDIGIAQPIVVPEFVIILGMASA